MRFEYKDVIQLHTNIHKTLINEIVFHDQDQVLMQFYYWEDKKSKIFNYNFSNFFENVCGIRSCLNPFSFPKLGDNYAMSWSSEDSWPM